MTGLVTEPTAVAGAVSTERKFRPDIEGLRAVAILLVVLYHARVSAVPGGYVGVDVFFVISGFLITRQLVTEVARTGKLSIAGFYARRMRRLLPASTLVLVVTLIAAKVWLPVLQLKALTRDVLYIVVYAMNYHLAAAKTNYLNADTPPSPLQHYWSLAVEEQFYFVWPLLILAVAVLASRRKYVVLTAVLAAIAAVSLWLSVTTTTHANSSAYFGLHTRAWELAFGALVAMTATGWARLPRLTSVTLAWCGLGMVVIAAIAFDDSTSFPGSAALLPVTGAALIIGGGCARLAAGPERLLGVPVMQGIGKVSYSWYLWHWPVILLAPAMLHRASLSTSGNLVCVVVALGLAVVTYLAVEAPTRSWRLPRRAWIATGVGLSSVAAALALIVAASVPSLQGHGAAVTLSTPPVPPVSQPTVSSTPNPSASATPTPTAPAPTAKQIVDAAVAAGLEITAVPSNLTPKLQSARVDSPAATFDGCHQDYLAKTQGPCVYGDPNGANTVVLFGDSHIEQWLPAFDVAGKADHWKVINWTKATCPLAKLTIYSRQLARPYPECSAWKAATIARIAGVHPDLIIAGSGDDDAGKPIADSAWTAATVATLRDLRQTSGATVVYFEDTPFSEQRGPACVAAHLSDVRVCNFPISTAYRSATRHTLQHEAVTAAGFLAVDPIQWLCTATTCPVIVGNLLVYRDYQHISASYSRWLGAVITPLLAVTWREPSGGTGSVAAHSLRSGSEQGAAG
jgi:peptidoglycan/LPS O-acetylase OafA/YrhL